MTPMDARDSHRFLDELLLLRPELAGSNQQEVGTSTGTAGAGTTEGRRRLRVGRAADCGAGIGRVTKTVLLERAQHVDLVEQSPRLLAAAPRYIFGDAAASDASNAERVSCVNLGLQVRQLVHVSTVYVKAVYMSCICVRLGIFTYPKQGERIYCSK